MNQHRYYDIEMRLVCLAIAVWAMCGCGGSRPAAADGHAPREQKTEPRAADARPAIVAFGDSLTAGFGVEPGKSYPDFLQQLLDAQGDRYRVVNQGVSGETTADGVARIEMVMAEKPALVILEFGANDGLRGLPLAATRANLERMIATLQSGGAQVVLAGMTLPPNYGRDYIVPFEAMYRDLARTHQTALIPFLLAGVAGTTEYMQRDGLHANVEGNRRVAATVMKTIEPLLKKAGAR